MSREQLAAHRAERLQRFLSAWRFGAPEKSRARRLDSFLAAYRQHRPPPPVVVARPELEYGKLENFLTAVQGPLERMRAGGAAINPWSVAGVGQNEVRNSAVLATLWSPQQCGSLGRTFLDAFCRRIDDPAGLLPTWGDLAAGYVVRTEHCPVGAASDRVDITIEGPSFVLGIEVKINAGEGLDQLGRYSRSVAQWARQRGGKRAAVVFLAPYPPSEADVLKASWRDVSEAGRKVVRMRAGEPTVHSFLLETFVRHCNGFGGKNG